MFFCAKKEKGSQDIIFFCKLVSCQVIELFAEREPREGMGKRGGESVSKEKRERAC
jgi:hypothetical protein